MDAKTSRALEASIQHWRENIAVEKPEDASTAGRDCALCHQFWSRGSMPLCSGCPVKKHTGLPVCSDTPYYDAQFALDEWDRGPESIEAKQNFKKAAQAELDFLISLREDEEDATENE